jgi:hypothetical protein
MARRAPGCGSARRRDERGAAASRARAVQARGHHSVTARTDGHDGHDGGNQPEPSATGT